MTTEPKKRIMPKRTLEKGNPRKKKTRKALCSTPHVSGLPAKTVRLIESHFQNGLSVREISEETGVSRSVVGRIRVQMKQQVPTREAGRKKLLSE